MMHPEENQCLLIWKIIQGETIHREELHIENGSVSMLMPMHLLQHHKKTRQLSHFADLNGYVSLSEQGGGDFLPRNLCYFRRSSYLTTNLQTLHARWSL